MRSHKSSSKDTSFNNPYSKPLVGTEVTTSKITRTKDGVKIEIYKKIL